MKKKRRSWDLVVCVRCHRWPDLILDTVDAVRAYTNRQTTKIMCAVDARKGVARRLETEMKGAVFCSGTPWGWGPGLYGLLAQSILWAESQWQFSHFLSIDYDTLFIGEQVDEFLLGLITDPAIGLIGEYNVQNVHWKDIYEKDALKIKKQLGSIPRTYRKGEGVQGGTMLITRSFINELKRRGMLGSPAAAAKSFTRLADDHLITLYCRICGLEIAQVPKEIHSRWQLDCDPFGLERKGIKVFHPTKIRPGNPKPGVEKQVRNYYRKLRGREPLI